MHNLTIYPVYIHLEPGCAYGAIVPDLPGVFSAADTLSDLPRMVKQAVELMYDGDDGMPPPSSVEAFIHQPRFCGGFWTLVDVGTIN